MTEARHSGEIPQPTPDLRLLLLVELPSRRQVFAENLRDLVSPRTLPPLQLQSAPAPFWPDVFVKRELPWRRFLESGGYHVAAFVLIVIVSRFIASQPRVIARTALDHDQVIHYQPSEYLPPLDTRSAHVAQPHKADPEFARQPIISVPREADNRAQTIVAPPNIKLKRDVAAPNIVAWADKNEPVRPQLEIPPVPLTPAAEITRMGPQMERSVLAPPPDATHLARRRDQPNLQTAVVAPPPDLHASRASTAFNAPQPSVIAPPPSAALTDSRPLGEMTMARSAVIAPAPQLAVAEQRAVRGGRSLAVNGGTQVVPPPPSVTGSRSSGASAGTAGRVIALNLHPTVGAPPAPPAGNRRGTFAATPAGHAGAAGTPGSSSGDNSPGTDAGSNRKTTSSAPSGLYVGSTAAKTSPVAGNAGGKTQTNSNMAASVHPARVSNSKPAAESTAKLSEAERAVFGNRKLYSMTLNMPNLNSGGGSWVVRFAELDHDPANHGSKPAENLSQPAATRKVDPAYPLQLMRENVAGTVILYAVIHADGTVGDVRVLRGVDTRLDQFATQAVAQWKFDPATKNGTPVDVEATFQIPFRPTRTGNSF